MNKFINCLRKLLILVGVLIFLGYENTCFAADVGHITAQSTTVSEDMNQPEEILQNVLQNTAVAVLGGTTAEDGTTWYHVVTLEGNEGYIRASDMTLGDPPSAGGNRNIQQTEQIQGPENDDGQDDADEPGEEDVQNDIDENDDDQDTDGPEDNAETVQEADFYVQVLTTATIRTRPTTDSEELAGGVETDTVLHVTGQDTDAEGTVWYQILYEDETGYISSQLVTRTEPPEGVGTEGSSLPETMTVPTYEHTSDYEQAPVQASDLTAHIDDISSGGKEEYREASGKKSIPVNITLIIMVIAAVLCGVLILKMRTKLKKLRA